MELAALLLLLFAVGTAAFCLGLIGRRGLVRQSVQDAHAHIRAVGRAERVRAEAVDGDDAATVSTDYDDDADEASMSEEYDVESLAATTARLREAAQTRAAETELTTAVHRLIAQQQHRQTAAAEKPNSAVDVHRMAAAHLQRQRDELATSGNARLKYT